ncbi:MAG TPA: hypothetical protein VNL14_17050 [Candidatus Acidoferrales bacterium]|nr:hypothetical protein [Candidatus Acidoferrales bacterium]
MPKTHFSIAILTVAMLLTVAGCATLVARSGISGLHEIPSGLSRKEAQERFGAPASAGTTALGRPIEIYSIRRQLKGKGDPAKEDLGKGLLICLLYGPICGGLALGAAAIETISFPGTLVESEMSKLKVAFVYGADDRAVYFYEPTTDPPSMYAQALRTLTHPFHSEAELAKCPSARECIYRYIDEARRIAIEVGYTMTVEDGDAFRKDIKLAADLDEGELTKEEVLRRAR